MLTVLSGTRAGACYRLAGEFATLGRHPSSDVRLDPERDLDVSARHAAVFRQGPTFVVRDLGSTNGTWVNGARIRSDRPLEPGDRIRLGARGPELEFTLVEAETAPPPPIPAPPAEPETESEAEAEAAALDREPAGRGAAAPAAPGTNDVPSSTDLRIRMEVARQTDRLRRRLFTGFGAAALLIAAGVAAVVWTTLQQGRIIAGERLRLLTRVDSMQRVLASVAQEASGLREVLDSARQETSVLRGSIEAEGSDGGRLASLDSVVADAMARHTPLARAAGFDAGAIEESQSPSVALLFAEFPDGRGASATSFVARRRADTVWLVTARHAVRSERGAEATRIALAATRQPGIYRARVVAVDDSLELALLRVVSRAALQPVRGLAGAASRPGDPVAVLGFPMGLELPMDRDWLATGVVPTTTVASVSRVLPDLVQLDGYGVAGVSGSPAFNGAGEVVGMVYGGQPESAGRIVYVVPAAAIRRFVEQAAGGV